MRRLPIRVAVVSAGLALCVPGLGITSCLAQLVGGSGGTPTGLGSLSQRNLSAARAGAAKGQVAPPPVLPGTKTEPDAVAPGSLAPDASPNDVLFDAINRGDIAAARDAMNRGASLEDRNILGQTPLELAVDLGRNDITFMLLSMRDGDASSRRLARGGAVVSEREAAVAEPARPVRRTSRAFVPAAADAAEPVVTAPRLYSGDGGSAIPAAGFVGFGRTSR